MTKPSEGKLLYHITHLDNIPSILEKGLIPRSFLHKNGVNDFTDVADQEILSKRESYKSKLSQYVLFHFYVKNPFDGAVCRKYGSKNMAIIAINRNKRKVNKFYIIPSHPLDKEDPDIYPYEDGFSLIRWDILDREHGRDYHDREIRNACMAECVIPYIIPSSAFAYIFVQNEAAKSRIDSIASELGIKVCVKVNPHMFPQ